MTAEDVPNLKGFHRVHICAQRPRGVYFKGRRYAGTGDSPVAG
jgi:hypothetical protein